MHKKIGALLVILGSVLILSALAVFTSNLLTNARAGEASDQIVSVLNETVAEVITEDPGSTESIPTETASTQPETLPVRTISGHDYIGTLSISALNLSLPVMQEWSYEKLKLAPCRQFGSPSTQDFVIAAHNYASHFGTLSRLKGGESVLFTDVEGTVYDYTVHIVQVIPPDASELVQTSGFDLTLYTCTPGGANRVAVFCELTEGS